MRVGCIREASFRFARAAIAYGLLGCGGEATAPAPHAPTPGAPERARGLGDAGGAEAGADAATAGALTLEVLATRGVFLAPGMREVTRFETDGDRSVRREILRSKDRDVCVRVAFAAGTAVHAWLEDAAGGPLADGGRAESGALGARGPVCVRRGDAVVLRVESDAPTSLRVMAWSAP